MQETMLETNVCYYEPHKLAREPLHRLSYFSPKLTNVSLL
jgi:hypothetical protein